MALKDSATRYEQNNKNFSFYQTTNLLKTWFLFLFSKERQKRIKNKFATKSVGIVATIIFL